VHKHVPALAVAGVKVAVLELNKDAAKALSEDICSSSAGADR